MKITFKKPLWFTVVIALCFSIITLFASTECKKSEKNYKAKTVTKIKAKVENASKNVNIVEVKLMVYDFGIDNYVELARSDWKDGGFTIELPKKLEPNCLHLTGYNRGILEPVADPSLNMTISNQNVKAGTAHFWGVDKDGNLVTQFYPFKIDEDGSVNEVFYSFIDSDVTISGSNEKEVIMSMRDSEKKTDILGKTKVTDIYSVKLKKGWNVWWFSGYSSVSERIIINKWSTAPFSNMKWYSFEDRHQLKIN